MGVLSLLIGISIALMGIGVQLQAPSQQAPALIEVVATTHDVDFPEEIVFHLEAEAPTTITEVTLFYRLAGGEVQVYGYPSFSPDRRVTADFTLKTDGSSYIPSGVDIQYFYRITDAAGNMLETEPTSLRYLDPRFDWQTLEVGDLVVVWHDVSEERVRRVATQADEALAAVKELFNVDDVSPKKVVVVNSSREARTVFPTISQTATQSHLFGGFAFGRFDLFVQSGLSLNTMVHEATHLMLDEAVSSPLAQVPAWLNEGLAMYFEPSVISSESTIARAKREGRLIPLRNMDSVPGRPADVSLFYGQARSLVRFMMESYGPDHMTALLGALNEGEGIDEAIPLVYGLTLDEMEQQWAGGVVAAPSQIARLDPGTVATSALLTAAAVFAAVVTLFKWLVSLGSS